MDSTRPVGRDEVTRQLKALGVEEGGVLLLHTSFRAVGPVDGGPEGFIAAIDAALGPEGTLVMPSWSDEPGLFHPGRSEAAKSLGVVARTFWRLEGVHRSLHPHAFAARGPRAEELLRDPLPLPPHIPESPVGRVHQADGQVLLAGVGHDADTTLHLAEILGGAPYRVPKQCLVVRDGRPTVVPYGENDHCCARFTLADGWLREAGLQREGPLGRGWGRLARARDIVGVVVARLRADPLVFLHPPDAGCGECAEAWKSVTGPSGV